MTGVYQAALRNLQPGTLAGTPIMVDLGADLVQGKQQFYETYAGRSWKTGMYVAAAAAIVVVLSLLAGFIISRRRTRDYAALVSCGANERVIARFAAGEMIVRQVTIGPTGFALGMVLMRMVGTPWVPPYILGLGLGITVAVFVLTGAIQAVLIARRLSSRHVLAALAVEGE